MSGGRRPSNKHIIGVPVLPAVSSTRQSIGSIDSLGGTTQEGTMSVSDTNAHSEAPTTAEQRWKLRHVDFIPQQIKSKKEDDYENFQSLVRRANEWCQMNSHTLVFSCETVTWTCTDHPVFTECGLMQKSMHSDKKTRFFRGLRLWYMVLDEVFHETGAGPGPWIIQYNDYTQTAKTDTLNNLINQLNHDISSTQRFKGKICKVETLHVLSEISDPGTGMWREQPDNAREYSVFLRVFALSRPNDGAAPTPAIVFRDFIPTQDNRAVHNQGYEIYSDLWKKAARWVYMNPDVKLINLQGVFVKIKKGGDLESGAGTLWDRLAFKEHGSAHGSLREQKTEYFQILRLVHVQSASQQPKEPRKKIFCKTFCPVPLVRPHVPDENDRLETSYEDLQSLQNKINSWINFSGAQVLGVETISTRLSTGGQETIGPEATFVTNGRERNVGREYWKNNVRLHIQGEFRETPVRWVSQIVENSTAATG